MKLYWRVKRNGKWTWVAATTENTQVRGWCSTEVAETLDDMQYLEEEK